MEDELTDIFTTPSMIKEINNANYKGYMKQNLEMKSGKIHAMSIKKKKTGKPLEA